MSALSVLFVQCFANDFDYRSARGYIDHFISAFLLNTLFLAKISGLVVGLAIVTVGLVFRGPFWPSVVGICLVLLFLAIMMAVDFAATGTKAC